MTLTEARERISKRNQSITSESNSEFVTKCFKDSLTDIDKVSKGKFNRQENSIDFNAIAKGIKLHSKVTVDLLSNNDEIIKADSYLLVRFDLVSMITLIDNIINRGA